jgi:hypothetical protein
MAVNGADLRERIELLVRGRDASSEEVADALTAGYGYALMLDSERLRIEHRISELAARAEQPEAARELRRLSLRERTLGAELADLRSLLERLREARLASS